MGKSTISTGPFSIATLNYQRVYVSCIYIYIYWLVVYLPLWKTWNQLGLWNSHNLWKVRNFMFQTTNQIYIYIWQNHGTQWWFFASSFLPQADYFFCRWRSGFRVHITCPNPERGCKYTLWLFNSSPWYRWPIEIDGLPLQNGWSLTMASPVNVITRWLEQLVSLTISHQYIWLINTLCNEGFPPNKPSPSLKFHIDDVKWS